MSEDSHDFIWPVIGPVTSDFDDPRPWGPHGAIDIAVPNDTPVLAVAPGLVSAIAHNDLAGNFVIIIHPDGWQTSYAHLRANPPIFLGQTVPCGSGIALSDNTGFSTGPHLHFVMVKDGVRVDPLLYLPQPPTQECPMTLEPRVIALEHHHREREEQMNLLSHLKRMEATLFYYEPVGKPDYDRLVTLTQDFLRTAKRYCGVK